MTSWESIQEHCHSLFGYKPSMMQARLWWLGNMQRGDMQKFARKRWAITEIGEWDVVIKLALSYTAEQLAKMNKRMQPGEINRFVYFLLWKSHQVRVAEATDKNGKVFNGQTFWGWACENRKRFEPVLSKRGMKSIYKALTKMAAVLEKQAGTA